MFRVRPFLAFRKRVCHGHVSGGLIGLVMASACTYNVRPYSNTLNVYSVPNLSQIRPVPMGTNGGYVR